ncbi:MAG: 3D domain-containing protein [Verrucomicrobiales bacterium]
MTLTLRLLAFLVAASALLNVGCSTSAPVASSVRKSGALTPKAGFYSKKGALYALVKTTAYSHQEKDSLKYGKACAAGCNLRYDAVRSAAADWSVFPLGTLFRIPGESCIHRIDDYGSALVGTRTIDLYQPTLAGVRRWGSRVLEIQILKWGSYSQSLQILADRTRHDHVRSMVNSIRSKRLVAQR